MRERIPSLKARGGMVWPLPPFLFAAGSVMALMAENLDQTSFGDVLPALAGTAAFAASVVAIVAALRRRFDAGTAVIAALWVAGALFYLNLFSRLNQAIGGDYAMIRVLPAAIAILGLLTLACHLLPRAMPAFHLILTGVALVLLAFPLQATASYAWRERGARGIYDADAAMTGLPPIASSGSMRTGTRPPDIYHFIFDRFGSEDMLAREYGIETGIGAFLEERGFYVAPGSHSNYLKTGHSLASTFHMDYLDLLGDAPDLGGRDWHPIFDMLGDHRVGRILGDLGYDRIQFGSWWVGTYDNPFADENHPLGFSEFAMIYLRRTSLLPVLQALPASNFTRRLDWDNGQCRRVLRQIEMIKALASDPRPEPIHVFVHLLVPHGPYPFAPDGRCLSRAEAAARGEIRGYADQVAYAARLIRELTPVLQEGARGTPVILVQADEGPFPERDYRVPWQEAPQRELEIKTAIINAYFFPSGDYAELSPAITPVNSYRAVLNEVFDAGFDLLPDRIFAFPNDSLLYDFHDVTASVGDPPRLDAVSPAGAAPEPDPYRAGQ